MKTDQPGHLPSLNRVFTCAQWVAKDPSFLHADSGDSDRADAQADLSSLCTHAIMLVLSCCGSILGKRNPVQYSPVPKQNLCIVNLLIFAAINFPIMLLECQFAMINFHAYFSSVITYDGCNKFSRQFILAKVTASRILQK